MYCAKLSCQPRSTLEGILCLYSITRKSDRQSFHFTLTQSKRSVWTRQNASPFLIYCYGCIKSGLYIKIWGGRKKFLIFIKLSNFATKFPNSKYFLFLPHLSQPRPPANSYLGPAVSSAGLAQPLAAAELQAGSASHLQGLWQGQDSGN